MKMTRRDFFPTAYLAAVAGSKLAIGKTPAAPSAGRFQFDPKTRRYSISGPVGVKTACMGIEVDGVTYWADSAAHVEWTGDDTGEAKITFTTPPVAWRVRFDWESDGHALVISSTLENRGEQAVEVGPLPPCWTSLTVRARCSSATTRKKPRRFVTNGTGNPPWRTHGLAPSAEAAYREVRHVFHRRRKCLARQIGDGRRPGGQRQGSVPQQNPDPMVHPRFRPHHAVQLSHFRPRRSLIESELGRSAQCPAGQRLDGLSRDALAPGASVDTEVFRIGLETDPHAALEAWGDAVYQRYHPPLWHNIPGGWLGWSWVDPLYIERYEDMVHRNIRAVRNRLKLDENYIQYVWVSIGNLKDDLPGNWLNWNYDRFPSRPGSAGGRPWLRSTSPWDCGPACSG